MLKIENALRTEVETMHEFLALWFCGDVQADQEKFETELVDRFAHDCRIIYPSGSILVREEFISPIFAAHGRNPSFSVAIRDFKLIALSNDNELATVCYIEDQFNALNSVPSNNSRFSTVVFRMLHDGGKVEWVHIHETAIT